MHLVGWFPHVVRVWVSFPFEEVLQGLHSPVEVVIDDGLDFVLVFPLDQFRGWFDVIGSVLWGFVIWGEEAGVEHVVDPPGVG
jgi:hypothetical protein